MRLFLGIDGGQSHTTALLADEYGRVLGRGGAGPSNHTREPGGRERLIEAVDRSTGEAMIAAGFCLPSLRDFRFLSAHLAMTGEPADKVSIIHEILQADFLEVAHDAPAALAGALAGKEGIIVLAGTGSVACGRAPDGAFVRAGGHGYLFDDRGSAFAIARDALSMALDQQDRGFSGRLSGELLAFFEKPDLNSIAQDVYAGEISRDRLASFSAHVGELADAGLDDAGAIIDRAATDLARLASVTASRLDIQTGKLLVSYGGGVFRNPRLMRLFGSLVAREIPGAEIVPPRFGPDIGSLLLAYRQAGIGITPELLQELSEST